MLFFEEWFVHCVVRCTLFKAPANWVEPGPPDVNRGAGRSCKETRCQLQPAAGVDGMNPTTFFV